MTLTRVVDERVLAPISQQKPAGDDLRALKDWVEIRKARPNLTDTADKRDWQPANPVKTDWSNYKDVVERALCTKSKDLELGVFLTEACARLHGFAGIRDGIWTLKGLLTEFADKGLYPLPEDGNLEARYGKLEWLNEKLAEVIQEVPITMRPVPAVNYSMNYRNEALRPNGMITVQEFDSAVAVGTREQYESLSKELEETRAELDEFEKVVNTQFGPNALSFVESKHALEDCQVAVGSILRKKQPASNGGGAGGVVTVGSFGFSGGGVAEGLLGDAWADAERMARSGEVDAALSTMTALAAAEANGRVRFQRKLLLVDICMQTNRLKLARSILEELNELVEKHNLTTWETSDMIGAVWVRLVRCYRDKNAGTANSDKAMEFFLKLSRLDPWQALAVGEPTEQGS
ncbi:MAG: type VI secretion system ImpA family N-terminal domain-containing protein [Acidobacteriia bacterium]|nr:type VI secretion system ImpA family N-terminal domain-containing protein [Terriglobia bacterium]